MAGNKVNTKTKGKEDKNKGNAKQMVQTSEETEEPDFALLRKPVLTSITGFGQARKIFDIATEELKDLLSNECDLLYECKVCRNLFRSVANFISHKRVYCKEKFNTSLHSHFIKATSTISELMKIKHLEKGYQESLQVASENTDEIEAEDRIPLTKDLTTIIEKISKIKGVKSEVNDEPQVALQKIPNSSVAVFQNIEVNEEQNDMRVQVKELNDILSKDMAVLQSDGNFKIESSVSTESENIIQISDDDDSNETDDLKCKICSMQFSTQKTLKFHMKYKHVESRLVYPCPDCLEIFSTSWSVYRHLFKVHRKTAAQIRRLRESIQAKAFKMNNPPAFYEKRKNNMKAAPVQKITEEERLEQENQAWMDNMEGDGELPRCGGCGRTFERRAALAAHTHTCPPRSRALAATRRHHETKKIEIQIRKDYNKGPPVGLNLPLKTTDANENKLPKEEPVPVINQVKEEEKTFGDDDKAEEDDPMDVSLDEQKSNDAESPEKPVERIPQVEVYKPVVRLPFAHQTEKNNLVAFRQRIQSEIDINKLLCKRCDIQCNDMQHLYDHVAEHLKWVRYACKLCNFKHYSFEKLPEHVKVVHKLKGDKDFYYSTVKAITGSEALELCESTDELKDASETSPDSRRPSRCSSDSSRLSDDSSSSSTRIEVGSGKRKLYHSKRASKRRKDMKAKGGEENKDNEANSDKGLTINLGGNDSSTSMKTFEENSSDIDEVDENISKRQTIVEDQPSLASRRPVRRKAKPKNKDFEYDLSNLLKMEAQGYRDSQSLANQSKLNQAKKKNQPDNQSNYDNANKDCCGALVALSKKAVEISAAHLKTSLSTFCAQKELKTQNIFVRPLLPKNFTRGDKISPKKDSTENRKDICSPNKDPIIESKINKIATDEQISDAIKSPIKELNDAQPSVSMDQTSSISTSLPSSSSSTNETMKSILASTSAASETVKSNIISPVVPIKFRRQSLEVIKNPIINKNISDFTKAGMKTKILVIKPINRSKGGKQTISTPLKFQTIKLKDPNKSSCSSEDKSSDQVVVVKVPTVDCGIAGPAVDDTLNNENASTTEKQNDTVAKTTETKDSQAEDVDMNETINNSNSSEDVKPKDNTDISKPECITSNKSKSSNDFDESVINDIVETQSNSTLENVNVII